MARRLEDELASSSSNVASKISAMERPMRSLWSFAASRRSTDIVRHMDRDGARFRGRRADAVGSLTFLTPLRANDQTGLDEHARQGWIDLLAQNDTGGIREQQRIARAGNLLIQRIHFRAR